MSAFGSGCACPTLVWGGGGGPLLLRRCTAILILPWPPPLPLRSTSPPPPPFGFKSFSRRPGPGVHQHWPRLCTAAHTESASECLRNSPAMRERHGGPACRPILLRANPLFVSSALAPSHVGPASASTMVTLVWGGGGGEGFARSGWGLRGQFQSGCRAVTRDAKAVGGAVTGGWKCGWGLVLGYGNVFGVE